MRRPPNKSSGGFTLVEILVALLILSIMSALGYGAYRAARISAERTELSLQRSREVEFGMRIVMQDLTEAVPRPVRDVLGQARLPAMRGTAGAGTVSNPGSSSSSGISASPSNFGASENSASSFGTNSSVQSILDITRSGWSNTAGQQRSTLQRVSYALVDDVLKRSYQINLDTVQQNQPVVQDLLTGVKGIQLRYMDGNQTWQNQWPLGNSVAELAVRPVAVEVIIEFKDWGRVRRLLEVAG